MKIQETGVGEANEETDPIKCGLQHRNKLDLRRALRSVLSQRPFLLGPSSNNRAAAEQHIG